MKFTHIIILIFFIINNINAQQIKSPKISFLGSKVEWIHTVIDSIEDVSFFSKDDWDYRTTGALYMPPKEINNKVIFNVDNFNMKYMGTLVSAYDLKSGDQLWAKNYNPYFEDDYGYGFSQPMDEDHNGNLVLSGFRGPFRFSGNPFWGYYAERTVDISSGNTISEYLSKEIIKTTVVCNPVKWASGSGDKSLFFYQIGYTNNGFYYPGVIDISADTIKYDFQFDENKKVHFNDFSYADFGNYRIRGPYTNDNERFTFLAVLYTANKKKHWIWITDREGTILKQEDITDRLGEYYIEAEQKDSLILLNTIVIESAFSGYGHRGYTLIDMEGNIVRRNSRMVIDGKKVGHMSTSLLRGTDTLIHVIRFQNDNDIYVYKETKEQQYIQAAHLLNPNSNAYAFVPKYCFQSSDDGLVISGSFFLDSIAYLQCKFDCGGWPVIMKLSAETLGIATSTSDASHPQTDFSIFPNPVTNTLYLKYTGTYGNMDILDISGRVIHQSSLNQNYNMIDIANLNAGIYFVRVTGQQGVQIGKTEKFIKIE